MRTGERQCAGRALVAPPFPFPYFVKANELDFTRPELLAQVVSGDPSAADRLKKELGPGLDRAAEFFRGKTVSLLIGELAYGYDSARDQYVKVAVLTGSLAAACLASIVLKLRNRHYRAVHLEALGARVPLASLAAARAARTVCWGPLPRWRPEKQISGCCGRQRSAAALVVDAPQQLPALAAVARALPVPVEGLRPDVVVAHPLLPRLAVLQQRLALEHHPPILEPAGEVQVAALVVHPGLLPRSRVAVVHRVAAAIEKDAGRTREFLVDGAAVQRPNLLLHARC